MPMVQKQNKEQGDSLPYMRKLYQMGEMQFFQSFL